MDFGGIPWLGVVVAVIAAQIIGFVWYTPLFGEAWMRGLGKTRDEVSQVDIKTPLTVGVVASILTAIALALVLSMHEAPDLGVGIAVGLVVAVGIMAAHSVSGGLWEGRNSTVTGINVGYHIVNLTVMAAIIGAMW